MCPGSRKDRGDVEFAGGSRWTVGEGNKSLHLARICVGKRLVTKRWKKDVPPVRFMGIGFQVSGHFVSSPPPGGGVGVHRMRVHLLSIPPPDVRVVMRRLSTPPPDVRVVVRRLSTPPPDVRVVVRQRAIR